MKKSTIGVVITAIIMIVAGAGLFLGGIMASGGVTAAKDAVINSGVDLEFEIPKQILASDNYNKFSKYDVDNLVLEIGAAEVCVTEKIGQEDIGVYTSDGKFEVFLKDDTLYIESNSKTENKKLEIYFPVGFYFENVTLSVGASAIEISGLNAGNFQAEIGAGKIIVYESSVEECTVEVGMGNFEYEGMLNGNCDFDCGIGNIELRLEGEFTDYNYEVDCAAGNVTIGDENFGGIIGDSVIENDADMDMDIECGMGNVIIEF